MTLRSQSGQGPALNSLQQTTKTSASKKIIRPKMLSSLLGAYMAATIALLLNLLIIGTQANDEMKIWKEKDHKRILEALRIDIYTEYDTGLVDFKYAPGSEKQNLTVETAFIPDRVTYADEKSHFKVAGYHVMVWNDSRISWEPSEKNNITSINLKPHKMWLPPVKVSNGYLLPWGASPRATVTYRGETTYLAVATVGTNVVKNEHNNLPIKEYECGFEFWLDAFEIGGKQTVQLKCFFEVFARKKHKFRPWKKSENNAVWFSTLSPFQRSLLLFFHPENANSRAWKITVANVESVYRREGTMSHSAIEYKILIRPKSSSFSLVFTLPIIVSTVFLILMYIFPLGTRKPYWVAFGAFLAFAQIYRLLYSHLPSFNSSPKIVKFYGLILVIFLLSLIETVLFEWVLKRLESSRCRPPPSMLQWLFGKLSHLFCYRNTATTSLLRLETQPIDDEAQTSGTEQTTSRSPELWANIVRVIDNVVFIVFSCFYILGLIFCVMF